MHGGSIPRGLALPQTTHGRYSKSVPVRLAANYERALADVELLSLRDEAALLSSQIDAMLSGMEAGETGALWTELRARWLAMMAEPDPNRRGTMLSAIGRLIERGATDASADRELRSVILTKARIAESERRRLADAESTITSAQLMAFVAVLSHAIIAEVSNRESRERIMDRFDRALRDVGPSVDSPAG